MIASPINPSSNSCASSAASTPRPLWRCQSGNGTFIYRVDKPLDTAKLHDIVRTHGAAANPGDRVQITQLDFDEKNIVVELNGGGRHHFHLRDHLQVGMGGDHGTGRQRLRIRAKAWAARSFWTTIGRCRT